MNSKMKKAWSKRDTLLAAVVLTLFVGLTSLGGAAPLAQSPLMAKVLIAFNIQPGPAEEALVRGVGGDIKYTYHLIPAIAATVPLPALEGLRRNPYVTAVDLDIEVHVIDAELENTWGVQYIGAGTVHASGNKGGGVKVAILDTGIDTNHPDLSYNRACSTNFVAGETLEDSHSHGTHTAGTVAALDNDRGVVGVAPEVILCIYKVLNNGGSGNYSDIIAALQQAVADDVQVTNNSYGSVGNPGSTVQAAFDNASAAGVLHVAATGNSGNFMGTGDNCIFPARWESVMATAATNQSDTRASFSSTCPEVELAAPGFQIHSTVPGGGFGDKSGTSMASPHVTGTAALVLATYPDWNNDQVRLQLQTTAVDLGDPGRDAHYGYGLVDAAEAEASGSNTPPLAHDQSVTAAQDTPVTITLTGSDPDDGDSLTFGVLTDPPNGALSGNAPNVTYFPDSGFSGPDSFTFNVNDGLLVSATATVSLTVTPVSAADTVSTTKATYNSKKNTLNTEASSSAGGAVTLTATAFDLNGNALGSVALSYNARKNKHKGSIGGLTSKPFRVEVTSSGGGVANVEGAAIGGKG